MGFCAFLAHREMATRYPPAVPNPAEPVASWLDAPIGPANKIYNIFVAKRADYDAAQHQYTPGIAWTWPFTNKTVFLEEYLPRAMRPESSPTGQGGLIATSQVKDLCSNGYQEGCICHECVGHGCHGSQHWDTDVFMHQSENKPHQVRLDGLAEWAGYYPTIRILPWTPGMNVFDYGEGADVPYTPQRPWPQPNG